MEHEFDAIFENGVLRPLEPLKLPNRSQVHVVVSDNGASPSTLEELSRQESSIGQLMEAMRSLPSRETSDGLSGRDHDKILYGWDKK